MTTTSRMARCLRDNRPLHAMPDGRLQCLRCRIRYQPDDPELVWVELPAPATPIGGEAISVQLGQARLERLNDLVANHHPKLTRVEHLRRAVDLYLDTICAPRDGAD